MKLTASSGLLKAEGIRFLQKRTQLGTFLTFVSLVSAAWAMAFDVSPNMVVFPLGRVGNASDEAVVLRGPCVIIKAEFVGDQAQSFSLLKSIDGVGLDNDQPFPVMLTFKPSTVGTHKSTLEISYKLTANGTAQVKKVEVRGTCESWNPFNPGDPAGRTCRIDPNSAAAFNISLPLHDQIVTPITRSFFKTHNENQPTYQLSMLDLLNVVVPRTSWDKTLSDFPADVPIVCINDDCRKQYIEKIKFNHIKGTKFVADFFWRSLTQSPLKLTSNGAAGGEAIRLILPQFVQGRAVISPQYYELIFDSGAALPRIEFEVTPGVFSGEDIHCLGVGLGFSVVRFANPNGPLGEGLRYFQP